MKTKTRIRPTPKRSKTAADNPEQYKRFREFAREVGADAEDPEALDRKFRKIVRPDAAKNPAFKRWYANLKKEAEAEAAVANAARSSRGPRKRRVPACL